MPLLLVDMDDTLVDRAATLERWAARRLPWVRPGLWHRLTRHLHVHRLVSRLAALYETAEPRSYRLEEGVREALEQVRRAGWSIAVITNGNRRTQPAKLASAQIEPLVDAVVISSHEGFAKPDPRDPRRSGSCWPVTPRVSRRPADAPRRWLSAPGPGRPTPPR